MIQNVQHYSIGFFLKSCPRVSQRLLSGKSFVPAFKYVLTCWYVCAISHTSAVPAHSCPYVPLIRLMLQQRLGAVSFSFALSLWLGACVQPVPWRVVRTAGTTGIHYFTINLDKIFCLCFVSKACLMSNTYAYGRVICRVLEGRRVQYRTG